MGIFVWLSLLFTTNDGVCDRNRVVLADVSLLTKKKDDDEIREYRHIKIDEIPEMIVDDNNRSKGDFLIERNK